MHQCLGFCLLLLSSCVLFLLIVRRSSVQLYAMIQVTTALICDSLGKGTALIWPPARARARVHCIHGRIRFLCVYNIITENVCGKWCTYRARLWVYVWQQGVLLQCSAHCLHVCVCYCDVYCIMAIVSLCLADGEKKKKNIKLSNNRAANKQQTHFSLCNFQMNSIDKNSNPSKFHKR